MDWGVVWEQLLNNYPKIAGYGLSFFVFGYLVWKVSEFYSETKKNNGLVEKISNSLNKIDRGVYHIEQCFT
ncbi:MAG: hypothetical protein Q8Q10_03480 [bacterium]|nr:hypothetical protein [bacterium]